MIRIETSLTPESLRPDIDRLFDVSARKLVALQKSWGPRHGASVFTIRGRYASRGWTEQAGFDGFNEVEIFSRCRWNSDQRQYLEDIKTAYLTSA